MGKKVTTKGKFMIYLIIYKGFWVTKTAQKMAFSIENFFSKCALPRLFG